MDSGKVLIVEDEPMLASMLTELLSEEGYAVTCITSGDEAAKRIEAEPQAFEAMVTDVNLRSEVDGFELAFMLRRRSGGLPPATVFMTGDSPKGLRHRAPEGAIFLEKPFRPSEIVVLLDRLLSQG